MSLSPPISHPRRGPEWTGRSRSPGSTAPGFALLGGQENTLSKFKIVAAMNGGVMFVYSLTLVYLNRRMLPNPIRIPGWRVAVMATVILFFGFFSVLAVRDVCLAVAGWLAS